MKDRINRQLAIWLYTGAFCIFIQIILGGITRLTGSGLSITEWQPLIGFLPPIGTASWQHSFEQYKLIAQFKVVNSQFTLTDYQSIFFWEWLHRNWARMIGFVFVIPFLVFIFKGYITGKMCKQLLILFFLGLLQAAIGWIMVKSGLNDTAIRVSDIRLAVHFMTAILLLCYILWMAFKLSAPSLPATYAMSIKNIAGITFTVLVLQMAYGALMAGSKAALAAPTFPDMNGYLIPPELYILKLRSDNTYLLAIQFIHRTMAGMTLIMVYILYKRTQFLRTYLHMPLIRIAPFTLVCTQIILGMLTIMHSLSPNYLVYAILHQGTGILLLISVLLIVYLSRATYIPTPLSSKKHILKTIKINY